MDQIKELRTLQDLCDHEYEMVWNGRAPLFLYQYIRDVPGIQRGTLLLALISSNLTACSADPRVPSRSVKINVYYEKKPGETEFKKTFYVWHGKTLPKAFFVNIFQDARLFYLGEIGKEISESFTPEDAAKKYFGSSDFSEILSYIPNRDYFNKRNTLKHAAELRVIPRYTESALTRIPLLGTHHPPMKSTFQKYWDAWNEAASTDSDSQRQWDAASNDLHRGMSAAFGALSLFPRVYNQKKKTDSEQKRIQEMVEVPASERSKLLTKGALSTQLMQRLSSQDPSVDKIKMFGTLHNRVHSQPKPNGGSKKSKTRKPRKPRKSRKSRY